MPAFKDLTGKRFGRLTVLQRAEEYVSPSGYKNAQWECACDCGSIKVIRATNLLNGKSTSCGCNRVINPNRKTHGKKDERIYGIWKGMKNRCNNGKDAGYKDYGGRGISVCEEWNSSFESFYNWAINNGYTDDLTIDRIDNNDIYSPDNCRWATNSEQQNNKRNNHRLTFNGETHTISEWGNITGLGRSVIKDRIEKLHWDVERALTTPCKSRT